MGHLLARDLCNQGCCFPCSVFLALHLFISKYTVAHTSAPVAFCLSAKSKPSGAGENSLPAATVLKVESKV